ncbi:MAG: hypothetical protein ACLTYN_04955 [Dysosmobacter welbionis]
MEEGNLAGRETELFSAPNEESEAEMLSALTAQYYLPRAILPHEILLPMETEDCEELSEVLTKRAGHKVWVHVPQRERRRSCGPWPSGTPRRRQSEPPPWRSGLPTPWSCWGRC